MFRLKQPIAFSTTVLTQGIKNLEPCHPGSYAGTKVREKEYQQNARGGIFEPAFQRGRVVAQALQVGEGALQVRAGVSDELLPASGGRSSGQLRLDLGVAGSAWGTVLAQSLALASAFVFRIVGDTPLALRDLSFDTIAGAGPISPSAKSPPSSSESSSESSTSSTSSPRASVSSFFSTFSMTLSLPVGSQPGPRPCSVPSRPRRWRWQRK